MQAEFLLLRLAVDYGLNGRLKGRQVLAGISLNPEPANGHNEEVEIIMTDEDARTEYEQLAALLSEGHLGWLNTQVERYLRFGRSEQREITVVDENIEEPNLFGGSIHRARRGPKSNFLALVEYTPQEQLQVLANAIVEAAPNVLEMANEVETLLRRSVSGENGLVLVVRESETGEFEEKTIRSEPSGEKLIRLRELLRQLVNEASE